MKRSKNYALRNLAGKNVIVPLGDEAFRFSGYISINETGVLLWNTLENDVDENALTDALLAEYNVDRQTALNDVREFVAVLKKHRMIEE